MMIYCPDTAVFQEHPQFTPVCFHLKYILTPLIYKKKIKNLKIAKREVRRKKKENLGKKNKRHKLLLYF